jgi:hypothetical protein
MSNDGFVNGGERMNHRGTAVEAEGSFSPPTPDETTPQTRDIAPLADVTPATFRRLELGGLPVERDTPRDGVFAAYGDPAIGHQRATEHAVDGHSLTLVMSMLSPTPSRRTSNGETERLPADTDPPPARPTVYVSPLA